MDFGADESKELIIYLLDDGIWEYDETYYVVDGQQRITTITMIIKGLIDCLPDRDKYFYERFYLLEDSNYRLTPLNRDKDYFIALLNGNLKNPENKSQRAMYDAMKEIKLRIDTIDNKIDFLKAIEKIDSFDNRCKLTSWLCQIAKNDYYDHLRRKHRHPLDPLPDYDLPNSQIPLEDMLADKELARNIRMAVHMLPEPYKEVFLLRVYAELPFSEIGQMFQKTEVWGRVTFLRAKEMILKRLEE